MTCAFKAVRRLLPGENLANGRGRPFLEFGHFPQTAERSNRIAQAAVAEAMAPLVLRYVTPKSQPRRRLCEVGRFSPGCDIKKRLALKALPTPRRGVQFREGNPRTASRGATDAQVCGLTIDTRSERRKALGSH